jgi:DNA-binding FadR family transcriptional regulator
LKQEGLRVFRDDTDGISEETIKRVDERAEQWLNPSRQMKRELKPEEHEEIVKAIAAGDRVKATSLYLSATEGDLTSAQNFIKTLILEKQAAQSQQPAKEGG